MADNNYNQMAGIHETKRTIAAMHAAFEINRIEKEEGRELSQAEQQKIIYNSEKVEGLSFVPGDDEKWKQLEAIFDTDLYERIKADVLELDVNNEMDEAERRTRILDLYVANIKEKEPDFPEKLKSEHLVTDYVETDIERKEPLIPEELERSTHDAVNESKGNLRETVEILSEHGDDITNNYDEAPIIGLTKEEVLFIRTLIEEKIIADQKKLLGGMKIAIERIKGIPAESSSLLNALKKNFVVKGTAVITSNLREKFRDAKNAIIALKEEYDLDREEERRIDKVVASIKALDTAYKSAEDLIERHVEADQRELMVHRSRAQEYLYDANKAYRKAANLRNRQYNREVFKTAVRNFFSTGTFTPISREEFGADVLPTDKKCIDGIMVNAKREMAKIEKINNQIGMSLLKKYQQSLDLAFIDKLDGVSDLTNEEMTKTIRRALAKNASAIMLTYIQAKVLDKDGKAKETATFDKDGNKIFTPTYKFNTDQLRQIQFGLEKGIDVDRVYANPELSAKKMAVLRMLHEENVKLDIPMEKIISMPDDRLIAAGRKVLEAHVSAPDFLNQRSGIDTININKEFVRTFDDIAKSYKNSLDDKDMKQEVEFARTLAEKYGYTKEGIVNNTQERYATLQQNYKDLYMQYNEANQRAQEEAKVREAFIKERDMVMGEKDREIESLKSRIDAMSKEMTMREQAIDAVIVNEPDDRMKAVIAEKDNEIAYLKDQLNHAQTQDGIETASAKDAEINHLRETMDVMYANNESQRKLNDELSRQVELLQKQNQELMARNNEILKRLDEIEAGKDTGKAPERAAEPEKAPEKTPMIDIYRKAEIERDKAMGDNKAISEKEKNEVVVLRSVVQENRDRIQQLTKEVYAMKNDMDEVHDEAGNQAPAVDQTVSIIEYNMSVDNSYAEAKSGLIAAEHRVWDSAPEELKENLDQYKEYLNNEYEESNKVIQSLNKDIEKLNREKIERVTEKETEVTTKTVDEKGVTKKESKSRSREQEIER